MVSNLVANAIRRGQVELHLAAGPVPRRWELWLMRGTKKRLRLLSSIDKSLLIEKVRQIKQDETWGAHYVEAD